MTSSLFFVVVGAKKSLGWGLAGRGRAGQVALFGRLHSPGSQGLRTLWIPLARRWVLLRLFFCLMDLWLGLFGGLRCSWVCLVALCGVGEEDGSAGSAGMETTFFFLLVEGSVG